MSYTKDEQHWHGFRHMASTQLHELQFNDLHIERQLSHMPRNKVAGVYNAAQYLPQRTEMMQQWADHLEALRDGAEVTPIQAAQ